MENRPDRSILDHTLRARYLRSLYLAELTRRARYRIGGSAGRSAGVLRDRSAAFDRR